MRHRSDAKGSSPKGAAAWTGRRGKKRALGLALASLLSLAGLTASKPAEAINDPYRRFWTIETPHFRIHYAKNTEKQAEHVAAWAEGILKRLAPTLGYTPKTLTHVVVTDISESANGSATALPYNTIRLFVTAPDDMSALGDYENWQLELFTHELTHILHIDNVRGLPAIANVLLGKTYAPNQQQPRWILEGLAVLEESKYTAGGRNRSTVFDMYMRADVLENNLATLDQISHRPRRWPGGNLWYLYGSRFLTWIEDTYGENAMRSVANDYGRQIVSYGINRSIRRATGRTYEELYKGWVAHLKRHYAAQIAEAKKDSGPLREGRRLTFGGRTLRRPRFMPKHLWRNPKQPEVVYFRSDAHTRIGIYRSALKGWAGSITPGSTKLFVRASGLSSGNFDAQGNFFYSQLEPHRRIYRFSQIESIASGQSAPRGDEPARAKLSHGLRAHDPDISPDGRMLVFANNRRGKRTLSIADIDPEGKLQRPRVLIRSEAGEQAYTPRFSPDGSQIAYSRWTEGGYRDICLVQVATASRRCLHHDRALEFQPAYSPDGKYLYLTSDRTGIPNIYAYELKSRRMWQVTNVRTGAFMPEPAPDGRHMVYVGYTKAGFDLYSLKINRKHWRPAQRYVEKRPLPRSVPPLPKYPHRPYRPFASLRPRSFQFEYGPGVFGQTLTLSTFGQDVFGFHTIGAAVSVTTGEAEPQVALSYRYGRLPFDWTASMFRYLVPLQNYRINETTPRYIEQRYGITNSIGYTLPDTFSAMGFGFSHTLSYFDGSLPVGDNLDPQSTITIDPIARGLMSTVRMSMSYSNTEGYLYNVAGSRGFAFNVNVDVAGPETASDYSLYALSYGVTRYLQMPWHNDHTVLLRTSGGMAGGDYPRRGLYFVGGLVETPLSEVLSDNVFQSGFALRGYPPNVYRGRMFSLSNVEYRFPLWHPERGISTLPVFLRRVSALGFLDYGGAFNRVTSESTMGELFHTGAGGELLVDLTTGYFVNTTTRIGYAKGFSREAYEGGRLYMVISAGF